MSSIGNIDIFQRVVDEFKLEEPLLFEFVDGSLLRTACVRAEEFADRRTRNDCFRQAVKNVCNVRTGIGSALLTENRTNHQHGVRNSNGKKAHSQ